MNNEGLELKCNKREECIPMTYSTHLGDVLRVFPVYLQLDRETKKNMLRSVIDWCEGELRKTNEERTK